MRALVIYCHPSPSSFNAAVRNTVLTKLQAAKAETRLRDLYAEDFSPVLRPDEHAGYLNCPANRAPVDDHCRDVEWADTLIFVYPTWWYGLPAMLKGWLDRVRLPDVAFKMPDANDRNIRPGPTHMKRLGVFTTCGASWWLTALIGAPGRRQLMQGVGWFCTRSTRKIFAPIILWTVPPSTAARAI